MALLPSPSAVIEITRYAAGQVVETVAAAATVPVRVLGLLSQTELAVNRLTVLAERAESLIDRVERVTGEAEQTISGANAIMRRVDELVSEAGETTRAAGQIVADAAATTRAAGQVVSDAASTTTAAGKIVTDAAATTAAAGEIVVSAGQTSDAAAQVVAEAKGLAATGKELLDGYAPTLSRAAPLIARFIDDLTPEEVTAAIRMVDQLPELRRHLTEDVMPLLGKLDQVGPDLHSLLEVTNDLHLAIVGMPGLKLLRRRGAERVAEENEAERR
ncbi:hypothetical protein [Actinoplanes sp. TFC3]|uniref:hypothetical protein n=1 Tax=Actinoplanes sp. TFC3 TaxID=1710355 RepID=UPI0008367E95|nr:hypothetical protein [Actinoplanes sp. TFC3]